MSFLQQYQDFIEQHHLFKKSDHLLLAVSGGVDSVVLCELCNRSGFQFSIAHCNFQLRGTESERDETFVRELAKRYQVPLYVSKIDTIAKAAEYKLSIQEMARKARYDWFHQILDGKVEAIYKGDKDGEVPQYILTAHHADDNIETMLMNFFKGTGITGLRGIQYKRDKLIRPLLWASKEQVLSFAKEHKLEWVEDSSNEEDKYSRNFLRNTIIPQLEKLYPELKTNLAENLKRFNDIAALYEESLEQKKSKLLEIKGNEVHIAVLKLKKSKAVDTLVYEIIRDFGFSPQQVSEVKKLMDAETGRYILSATHRMIKNRRWLIITPKQEPVASLFLIKKEDTSIVFGDNRLEISVVEGNETPLNQPDHTALVDAKEITYPLILRKWRQGDYFYPLGLRKKKKLARFFIDQKLSAIEKEKVWILESHKRIVWVLGYRIDDRFKRTDHTEALLKLNLVPF